MNEVREMVGGRFREAVGSLGEPGRVVVAVSGGLDSCVLLHLARFEARAPGYEWLVAHFDHRMRDTSDGDARWLAGLCRAWGLPLRLGRADGPLTSEAAAREARYSFLERARREAGASLVFTAHHADDQAETVLFRLLRGTGTKGLGGIHARRGPTVARPLLDLWRVDLEGYAREARLSWRDDPSNADLRYARNALRHRVLPDMERWVAPAARRSLVRLADLSSEDEAAWDSVLPSLMEPLQVLETEGGISFERAGLLALHAGVRARVLRALASRLDLALDRRATARALDFTASGRSGRAIDLGASVSLGLELDRCVLGSAPAGGPERALAIPGPGPGRGAVVLAGSSIPVAWGGRDVSARLRSEDFEVDTLRFPLTVRARRPGDRIKLTSGTKKVKKLFLEGRIPLSERHRVPLVVDADGEVLWIPGVARARRSERARRSGGLRIGVG